MALETNNNKRLQELGGSDFEIADGQPDIRGWDVKDATGKRIGEVDDLIFDVQSRKVRYMKIDLEGNVLDLESRDVLVPIGLAELHNDGDDVILNGVTADQLGKLPKYDKDSLDETYERTIRSAFAGVGGAAIAGGAMANSTESETHSSNEFYDHEHFNDDKLYRNRKQAASNEQNIPVIKEELNIDKREVETGGIRLRSRIVENEVEENIHLRTENVNIEHVQVDRPAAEEDFQQNKVEMHESEEVPVVNKEARVVEEISLQKDVTERDETIRDTVRETDIDINKDEDRTHRDTDRGSIF